MILIFDNHELGFDRCPEIVEAPDDFLREDAERLAIFKSTHLVAMVDRVTWRAPDAFTSLRVFLDAYSLSGEESPQLIPREVVEMLLPHLPDEPRKLTPWGDRIDWNNLLRERYAAGHYRPRAELQPLRRSNTEGEER